VSDISAGTGTIDTDGSVLLHGVTTGLEARW
jgi:PDZ domain-containing secreted protein